MGLHYDKEADALYLRLDESEIVESEEVQPGIVLDFNANQQLVGIEIMNLEARVPGADPKMLQFEKVSVPSQPASARNRPHSKYDHVYPIIRLDRSEKAFDPEHIMNSIMVVKVLHDEERAREEVSRLNEINRDKQCQYFFTISRLIA